MRSSYFISPNHPNKICDIATESVIQLYTNTKEVYYSDIFSFILENKLYLKGWINCSFHFSFDEIKNFIVKNIDNEIDIIIDINQYPLINDVRKIEAGTFIGYSNNENIHGIPFEHLEVKNLNKFLYEKTKLPIYTQLTINGHEIKISIQSNFDNDILYGLTNEYLKNKEYVRKNIKVNELSNSNLYLSNNCFISNTYGPRSSYGNTRFVGLDIFRNIKLANLVAREISDFYVKTRNLNYAMVELTYEQDNEIPIQIGIKGNNTGIHIDNGTFFELIDPKVNYLDKWNKKVFDYLTKNENNLIEMAKWGYF